MGLSEVRVEVLAFDGVMIPGPRIVETARRFAMLLRPGPALESLR